MRLKQRITGILIREIIADVDENHREIVLLMHWAGGRHSELRLRKSETGKHRHCTSIDAIEVIRKMAGKFSDEQVAATLNRLRLRTGADNTWNETRVYSVRHRHQLSAFDPDQKYAAEVTLKEAAQRLNLSPPSIRRMIADNVLPAHQVVECAPWQIPVAALDSEAVRSAALKIRNRIRVPKTNANDDQQSMFSDG